MSRGPIAIVGALALAGCFPIVSLGRDETATTGGLTDPTDAGGGTSSFATDQGADSESSSGTVAESSLGSGSASGGADGTMPTGSSTGGVPGPCAGEADSACQSCAQEQCCDELLLCASQPSCECFLSCVLGDGPPQECQSACTPTSGVAAVIVCVQMSCGRVCNVSEDTASESTM